MHNLKNIFFCTLASIAMMLAGCANVAENNNELVYTGPFLQYDSLWAHADSYPEKIEIRYAKGLRVDYRKDGIHIFISNPSVANSQAEEFVISQGKTENKSRFICTTALQLGNFEILGIEDRIVGMNSLKNIFSPRIKEQIASGKTMKVGKEGNFDLETVIAAKPDYIFVSASKFGGFESLKECGVPLIPHHGYRETDPLGQAEWVKLVGLLTGETQRANAVFADIEKKYNDIKAKVSHIKPSNYPTILSGRQLRDGWYVMGGKSYMAKIFSDAGAKYVFASGSAVANATGGTALDFETVYARGIKADYWQTDGSFDGEYTLDVLKTEDARYADITAFKKGHVLFCNLSQTPYRELGALEPHRILADFVKAMHPEVLPAYTPKYYKLLNE